jgi:hypothetical protein
MDRRLAPVTGDRVYGYGFRTAKTAKIPIAAIALPTAHNPTVVDNFIEMSLGENFLKYVLTRSVPNVVV